MLMFSSSCRLILLRSYSKNTLQPAATAALKLWAKHNGAPSTQVPINDSINIDDFAKNVKKDFKTNCQVALFTSIDKDPIHPWLKIEDLLKADLKMNAGDTPLFVKLISITPDSTESKNHIYS